jgi:protein ImuA
MQGFKPLASSTVDTGLGLVAEAFPQRVFPIGAMHEFICDNASDAAATSGFVSGILSSLMSAGGACLWIGRDRRVFPPALAGFGIQPHRVIFVDLKREKAILWAVEESLKCQSLAAVVGEVRDLSPIAARRLQLAVEHSSVTGFLLRNDPRSLDTIASVARWKIAPLPSRPALPGMPGVGHTRWKVELSRVRNGKPGSWEVEWSAGRFHTLVPVIPDQQSDQWSDQQPGRKPSIPAAARRKAG